MRTWFYSCHQAKTQTTTKTSSFTVFCKKVSTQKCCAFFSFFFLPPQNAHVGNKHFTTWMPQVLLLLVPPSNSHLKRWVHTLKMFSHSTGLSVCPRPGNMSVSPRRRYVRVPQPCPRACRCVQVPQVCWTLSTGCCCVAPTCNYQTVSPACLWVFNGDRLKTDMKPQVTDDLSLTKAFPADIYDILEIQMENLLILCCVFFLFFFNI